MTRNEGKRERLHGQVEARLSRIIGSQLDMFPNAIAILADAVLDEIWHELDERLNEAAQETIRIKDRGIEQRDVTIERARALAQRWVDEMPANVTESAVRVIRAQAGAEILRALELAKEEKNLPSSGGAA